MIDWIAVLRAASGRLSGVGATAAASVGVALLHALEGAANELERQRDAAQGNGEEGRIGAGTHAPADHSAEADQRAPSPASIESRLRAERDEWHDRANAYMSGMMEAVRDGDALRAKLAEREKLIDATATAWLTIDGIPWEGAIDAAMKAAVAEIVRLRARLAEREAELAALIRALRGLPPEGTGQP